MTSNKLICYY